MKKDLIDTIMEKEFHALTDAERKELTTFCTSEDEYNQMKDVFVGVERMAHTPPAPKAETKERLDDLFSKTYPKAAPVWYNSVLAVVIPREKAVHRQPLVQIAAILLLAFLFVPFGSDNTETPQKQLVVQERPEVNVTEPMVEPNEPSITVAKDAPSGETSGASKDIGAGESPVLIASAELQPASAGAADDPSSPSEHPDGVFIAVSQPASENPEVFDLLTATF